MELVTTVCDVQQRLLQLVTTEGQAADCALDMGIHWGNACWMLVVAIFVANRFLLAIEEYKRMVIERETDIYMHQVWSS